jgi:hypothetical protein
VDTQPVRNSRAAGPLTFLIGIRTALAASALLAPRLSARLFGIDPDEQPAVSYLARLFGGRNAVLALGLTRLEAVGNPAAFVTINVVVDLADAAAAAAAGRKGELSRRSTATLVAPALLAAGLGLAERIRLERTPVRIASAPTNNAETGQV